MGADIQTRPALGRFLEVGDEKIVQITTTEGFRSHVLPEQRIRSSRPRKGMKRGTVTI
eukprot:jgi/Botrbrau1/14410/Bobra.0014s0057.1